MQSKTLDIVAESSEIMLVSINKAEAEKECQKYLQKASLRCFRPLSAYDYLQVPREKFNCQLLLALITDFFVYSRSYRQKIRSCYLAAR